MKLQLSKLGVLPGFEDSSPIDPMTAHEYFQAFDIPPPEYETKNYAGQSSLPQYHPVRYTPPRRNVPGRRGWK
jgi:hypothetical protein